MITTTPQRSENIQSPTPKSKANPSEVESEKGGKTKLFNAVPVLVTAMLIPKASESSLPMNHLLTTTFWHTFRDSRLLF